MTPEHDEIISLLYKRLTGNLNPDEEGRLDEWVEGDPRHRELLEKLSDPKKLGDYYRKRALVNPENAKKEMEGRLRKGNLSRAMTKALIGGTAAAALVIILFSVFAPSLDNPDNPALTADSKTETRLTSIDSISAGESIAYISEGDGKTVVSMPENSAPVPVKSLMGVAKKGPVVLEVPKGGEFMVMLDDSTRVWLNSSSTLIYPEDFGKNSRRVKVSGEAYFAVTKDNEQNPFYVECEGEEIKVYGTEFNVRSYPEEEDVFTSLSKGSVSVRRSDSEGGELFITPGSQAVFNKESKEAKVRKVNIETVTGWRNGRFVFEDQTLWQIMNDLGRWYNFEFEFADSNLKDTVFKGSIPRYADFSTAILILEKTGDLSFDINDNKIIVNRKSK